MEEVLAPLLEHTPAISSELPVSVKESIGITDDEGRMALFMYWWRTGELLDYVLGEPGLSAKLRVLPPSERLAAIPARLRPAILEANIDASFPPTVFVHGLTDTVILPSESQATHDRLSELGVRSELITVPQGFHGLFLNSTMLEIAPGAEEAQEKALNFLAEELRRS